MPGPPEPWRAVGWSTLVLLLLAQVALLYLPAGDGPALAPGSDKVGHALLFGLPGALAVLLGHRWVLPILVLHALVSEPLQGWLTSTRQADPWDLVADLVGIVLGVVVAEAAVRRRSG